jgi:hypothetical protein
MADNAKNDLISVFAANRGSGLAGRPAADKALNQLRAEIWKGFASSH